MTTGFDADERERVGRLYWDAFGPKLMAAFRHERTGRRVIAACLHSDRVLLARNDTGSGEVVGVCGYHQDGHGAVDMTWRRLRSFLSPAASVWALAALGVLSRPSRSDVLVLDGICVDEPARSRGVGSMLLDAALDVARGQGKQQLQLSVIEANPRARALYERHGFAAVERGSLGPLRHLYGFDRYITMRKEVPDAL